MSMNDGWRELDEVLVTTDEAGALAAAVHDVRAGDCEQRTVVLGGGDARLAIRRQDGGLVALRYEVPAGAATTGEAVEVSPAPDERPKARA